MVPREVEEGREEREAVANERGETETGPVWGGEDRRHRVGPLSL